MTIHVTALYAPGGGVVRGGAHASIAIYYPGGVGQDHV